MNTAILYCDGAEWPNSAGTKPEDAKSIRLVARGRKPTAVIESIGPRIYECLGGLYRDLLRVAAFIYLGDRTVNRGHVDIYGEKWHRDFHYVIPVSDPAIDKLMGKIGLAVLVPELDMDSKRVVQCPMSGTVPLTERMSEILKHPALRRLMSVTQLGLLAYVYPNATHSRYEHSLGAYGNCVRMLHSLWEDQQNPMFRLVMNKADMEACLLATFLHDLGQYPLAHDLEEADPDFFHHEDLLGEFLQKPVGGEGQSLATLIDTHWGAGTTNRVKSIFASRPNNFRAAIKDRILHTIVDGPLDADKLDYIARDSSRLGLSYGQILDYERIFNSLTVVHERKGDDLFAVIGIHEKGRTGAECVAFARYALFSAAYWHHTSRAIKSIIHRAVSQRT